MAEPLHYLLRNACAHDHRNVLASDADYIRLYQHISSPEWTWWMADVSLARNGKNRRVRLRSLEFDLELPTRDFIERIDEFEAGGISLVQSEVRLPHDLHPSTFATEGAYLKLLSKFRVRLLFELPHVNETAGITLFNQSEIERIKQTGTAILENSQPRQSLWQWRVGN